MMIMSEPTWLASLSPPQTIAAEGELNAARALKEAAETIASSSTAMQLRYLQTLNIIAAERGSTIVFPIPIDMLGPMVRYGVMSEMLISGTLGGSTLGGSTWVCLVVYLICCFL